MPEYLTDQEWHEFQRIPDEGYSHRAWVDARIDERIQTALAGKLVEGKVIDVRFTFKEGEPEEDGYRPLDLERIERTRCDLDESQQLGVGEDWAQSDRYSIGISLDLISVVSDGAPADYSQQPPRTY